MLYLALALWGLAVAVEPAPSERSVDIVVDVTAPETGWLSVEAVFHDLDRRELKFRRMGNPPAFEYADVVFTGVAGPIDSTLDTHTWTLIDPPSDGPITVRWRVKPGGMGRHGHQGFIDPTWASFDGRILLLPQSRRSLRTARFRFERPDGWTIVHPWVEKDGWLVAHDSIHLKPMITATCVAMGPFEIREQDFGKTTMRVGALSAWDPEHREALFTKTFGMFSWFHDQLGYDRRHPFAIAWLPKPNDTQVFGGASVNGACYQHPVERDRNWLLLGHRIGHPYNKYTPSGMSIRDARDHWFMEGWASYIEVVAAHESGALPDQSYWNTLYRRYLRDVASHPEWDLPLLEEPTSGEAHEFLHYTKGPLVVKHLDTLMRQRSGVSMESFMRAMHKKYGFHRDVFPLRDALETFTGDTYDDFWAAFVDQRGDPFPLWTEVVTDDASARADTPPVAWIGQTQVHPEYLKYLAWSGDFERYADVVDFLQLAAHREAVLASRGALLLPAALEPHRFVLPVQAQYAVAKTAMGWRSDSMPVRSGCFGATEPSVPSIRWSESPDAVAFLSLLELERAYEEKLGRVIQDVQIRDRKGRRRLVVGPGQTFSVHTTWTATPPRAGFELRVQGQTTRASQITIDPSWTRTHVKFSPDDRPRGAAVLTVAVGPDARPLLELPIWQTQAPFLKKDPPQEPR